MSRSTKPFLAKLNNHALAVSVSTLNLIAIAFVSSNSVLVACNEFGQKVLDLVVNGYKEERDGNGDLTFAGNMAEVYKELKGKQFTTSEFYGILGEEIAEKILKWAEQRGLVNHKMVGGEEYVEFL